MALDAATPRAVYSGNGATTAFDVQDGDGNAIYFAANSEINVQTYNTTTAVFTDCTEGVEYTLAGGPTTGVVTFVTAPASGTKVVIWRETVLDQSDSFSASGSFSSTTHNSVAQKHRRIDQELQDKANRALKLDRVDVAYDAGGKPVSRVTYLELDEASAPDTPVSGRGRVYTKTDGDLYHKNDAGTETNITEQVDLAAAQVTLATAQATAAAGSASAAATSASASASSASASAASAATSESYAAATAAHYVVPSSTVVYEHLILDTIEGSFDGATVTFALTTGGAAFTPASAAQLVIHLNGVYQEPTATYSISGTNITFTTAPAAGDDCIILALKTAAATVPVVPTAFMETLIETANDAATARTQLSAQESDAALTSIAGLTIAADKMLYGTGADTFALADLTAAGRALLDDADASAQRTTMGVRTSALDSIEASFNGALTSFNLAASAVSFTPRDPYGVICVFNGVVQVPGDAYTVSGSQITFTFTPQSGDACALWAVNT